MSLTIAETAERTGLTVHTLRYYERDGLMLDVDRSPTGHRRYRDGDVEWIEMISRLRRTGMPIRDVRRYAELVRAGDGTHAERLALLERHRDQVRAQLAETADHLERIELKIALYRGLVDSCEPAGAVGDRLTASALEVTASPT